MNETLIDSCVVFFLLQVPGTSEASFSMKLILAGDRPRPGKTRERDKRQERETLS